MKILISIFKSTYKKEKSKFLNVNTKNEIKL